jgi:hypothetical protein
LALSFKKFTTRSIFIYGSTVATFPPLLHSHLPTAHTIENIPSYPPLHTFTQTPPWMSQVSSRLLSRVQFRPSGQDRLRVRQPTTSVSTNNLRVPTSLPYQHTRPLTLVPLSHHCPLQPMTSPSSRFLPSRVCLRAQTVPLHTQQV